jgi:hypothetical protein
MPTFISEQARRDYYTIQDTMRRAEFTDDLPVLDWCERFLSLCRPMEEIRRSRLLPEHINLRHQDLVPKQPRLIEEP